MSALPARADHRPWPIPRGPWLLAMRWTDLAFLHWPVEPERVRPLVPAALELGVRDGAAWIGLTPFLMSRVRPRGLPPAPLLSTFPELNLRTYVTVGGKPGVWFFSLDAGSALAVLGARAVFGLPYHVAAMRHTPAPDESVRYRSARIGPGPRGARFEATYRPTGPVAHAAPGTLEHWLAERYCLYSVHGGRLMRGEIHHAPWPLRPASVSIEENGMGAPAGLSLDRSPPLVHYARRLDVVAWGPTPVGSDASQRT